MTTIHYPLQGRSSKNLKEFNMQIVVEKRVASAIGVGRAGATEPKVRIAENGQVTFNSLAMKVLEGRTYATIGFDPAEGVCELKAIKFPTEPPKFPVKIKGVEWAKEDFVMLNWSKDKKTVSCSVSGNFKAYGYDYRTSGSQGFPATVEGLAIQFKLPKGALPKVVSDRKPRTPKVAGVVVPNGAPAANADAAELDI
jgi:hypothetical protein